MREASYSATDHEARANRALISICMASSIAAAGGFYLWFGNLANQQGALRRDFAALDRGPAVTFAVPIDCTAKGQFTAAACGDSQTQAMQVAQHTPIASYTIADDCVKVHGPCNRSVTLEMVVAPYIFREVTRYSPQIAGWQAMASDLSHAVPLYSSAQPGTAVRADGKVVPFGPSSAP